MAAHAPRLWCYYDRHGSARWKLEIDASVSALVGAAAPSPDFGDCVSFKAALENAHNALGVSGCGGTEHDYGMLHCTAERSLCLFQ